MTPAIFPLLLCLQWLLLNRLCVAVIDFGNCTFETNSCNWEITEGSAILQWSRLSAKSNFPDAPTTDFTFGTRDALFLFAATSFLSNSSQRTIVSAPLRPEDGVCGVRLAHAARRARLTAILNENVLAELKSDFRVWQVSAVSFVIESPSIVAFRLEVERGESGFGALDNVQFIPCARCTFENGTCDWIQGMDDTVNWTSNQGKTVSLDTGPSIDHTTASALGVYLYVEATKNRGKKSRLVGRWLEPDDNICSIQFFMHMTGKDIGELELLIYLSNEVVAERWVVGNVDMGDEWIFKERAFKPESRFRFEFLATIGTGSKSDIALDDVQYLTCTNTDKCSFKQDMCSWGYGNNPSQRVQWKLQPSIDSIRLVADFSSESIPENEQAAFEGRIILSDDDVCSVRVEYELTGNLNASTLLLRIYGGKQTYSLLGRSRDSQTQRTLWEQAIPKEEGYSNYVYFESRRENLEKGTFVIHSLQYLSCFFSTFEEHPRRNDWKSDFWSLEVAGECQRCPLRDHTYNSAQIGHYYFISGPNSAPLMRSNIPDWLCGLRFWYYAFGVPTLSVELLSGEQKNISLNRDLESKVWTLGEIEFTPARFENEIAFVALGMDSQSSLALDDIELTRCSGKEKCTFESSLCGWTLTDDSESAEWIRWRGSAHGKTLKDHTKKTPNGYYLLFSPPLDQKDNQLHKARVGGIPIGLTSDICGLEFFYMLDHDSSCTDSLLWISVVYSSQTYIVWVGSSQANAGLSWQDGNVLFQLVRDETSHVEFQARSRSHCIIAVDDIQYVFCSDLHRLDPIPNLDQSLATLPVDDEVKTFSTSPSLSESSSSSAGVIAGAVVGGILFLVLLGVVIFVLLRKRYMSSFTIETSKSNETANNLNNPNYGGSALPGVVPDYAEPCSGYVTNPVSPKSKNPATNPSEHEYAELDVVRLSPPHTYTGTSFWNKAKAKGNLPDSVKDEYVPMDPP